LTSIGCLVIEDKRFFIGALYNYFIEVAPVMSDTIKKVKDEEKRRKGWMDLAVRPSKRGVALIKAL